MATTRGYKGQTAKVFFGASFVDATGAAVDPTGTPTLKVWYVDPAGSLTLKATLNLAKQQAITGFWGAFLDISDGTNYPAGDYQITSVPTVSAIVTVMTDSFEIDESPTSATAGFIAGSYCSEQQVRDVATILLPGTTVPSLVILNAAWRASRYIDLKLGGLYVVPFTPTYNDGIVLLTIWLAAGYAFENLQGQRGNINELGATLIARADGELADLALGKPMLPLTLSADVQSGAITISSEDRTPAFSVVDDNSPLKAY